MFASLHWPVFSNNYGLSYKMWDWARSFVKPRSELHEQSAPAWLLTISPNGGASQEHSFVTVIWQFSILSLFTVPQKPFTAFKVQFTQVFVTWNISYRNQNSVTLRDYGTFQTRTCNVSRDRESCRCHFLHPFGFHFSFDSLQLQIHISTTEGQDSWGTLKPFLYSLY